MLGGGEKGQGAARKGGGGNKILQKTDFTKHSSHNQEEDDFNRNIPTKRFYRDNFGLA